MAKKKEEVEVSADAGTRGAASAAPVGIKVRSNFEGTLAVDTVVISIGGTPTRMRFTVNPVGTPSADCVATLVPGYAAAEFTKNVEALNRLTIKNNPKYDDVKSDTDGDGVNDTGLDNWAKQGLTYVIV